MRFDSPASRWKEVQRIASRLLETPENDRDSILDRECLGDAELRAAVLEILAHYSDSSDLFGCPPLLGPPDS